MKILGVGNAIVDVICKVNDNFIIQNNLTKSTMKLVDEIEFKKVLIGMTNPVSSIASGNIFIDGGSVEFLQFLSKFR